MILHLLHISIYYFVQIVVEAPSNEVPVYSENASDVLVGKSTEGNRGEVKVEEPAARAAILDGDSDGVALICGSYVSISGKCVDQLSHRLPSTGGCRP